MVEKYDCHCSKRLITQPQLPSAEAVVPSKKSHCSRKPLPRSYSLIMPNYCMQSWALKVAHHALMKNTWTSTCLHFTIKNDYNRTRGESCKTIAVICVNYPTLSTKELRLSKHVWLGTERHRPHGNEKQMFSPDFCLYSHKVALKSPKSQHICMFSPLSGLHQTWLVLHNVLGP